MEKIFKGKIGNYEIRETKTGDYTIWSEKFDETCHSLQGAYAETVHTYLNGCNIPERINNMDELNLFETGFGIGLGLQVVLDFLKKNNIKAQINYLSVELDIDLIEWRKKNIDPSTPLFDILNGFKLYNKNKLTYLSYNSNGNSFTILIGDALETIPLAKEQQLIPQINTIFQDAFSPQKNPTLWTIEWFKLLTEFSSKKSLLSTYSAASQIKRNLIECGWEIKTLPGYGTKKSMTQSYLPS